MTEEQRAAKRAKLERSFDELEAKNREYYERWFNSATQK